MPAACAAAMAISTSATSCSSTTFRCLSTRSSSARRCATIDVLYDLAFLLMDLDARGDRQAANAVLNAYVAFEPIGGEIEGLACLPLFLACRAGVRAVVAMARTEQARR